MNEYLLVDPFLNMPKSPEEAKKEQVRDPNIARWFKDSRVLWEGASWEDMVKNMDEAMSIANDVNYGLTAGFYGSAEETEWFFDKIEAGVTYANRPQGATTGAWPGFQPFGGWKGSGSSGKNAGGHYYLPLYMHEQIRTLIK